MSRLPVLLTTGVLAAALGAGALGVASAATPTPAPSTSDSAASKATPAKPGKHAGKALLRRVAHGEVVVRHKGGFQTIALQRGEITAVSAASITLKSKDGYAHSYAINSATKIRSQGKPEAVNELKAGERAMVRAVKTGSSYTAARITCVRDGAKAVTPVPETSTSS